MSDSAGITETRRGSNCLGEHLVLDHIRGNRVGGGRVSPMQAALCRADAARAPRLFDTTRRKGRLGRLDIESLVQEVSEFPDTAVGDADLESVADSGAANPARHRAG
jgi:hypothetical protein